MLQQLLSFSDDIYQQHGLYHDELNSIGIKAFEKAKLELVDSKQYDNLEMPAAQEAIYVHANEELEKVILQLVHIKLADGEDVDKLKEMNETKQNKLDEQEKDIKYLKEKHDKYKEELRKKEEENHKKEIENVKAEVALEMERTIRKEMEERNKEVEEKSRQLEQEKMARVQAEKDKIKANLEKEREKNLRLQAEQAKEKERKRREQAEEEKDEAELETKIANEKMAEAESKAEYETDRARRNERSWMQKSWWKRLFKIQ